MAHAHRFMNGLVDKVMLNLVYQERFASLTQHVVIHQMKTSIHNILISQ